jgi:hypothetical protein
MKELADQTRKKLAMIAPELISPLSASAAPMANMPDCNSKRLSGL